MKKIILLLIIFTCVSCSYFKKEKIETTSLITPPDFEVVPGSNDNQIANKPTTNKASQEDINKVKKALLKNN